MELTARQADALGAVAARFGLRLIVAFGSRVTGRDHQGSDLDIAVLPTPGSPVTLHDLADMIAELSRIFPGTEVDVSLIPHADPLFLKKIFETGILLYGDATEFRRYRVYAFRRYSEYLPYLRLEEEATRALVRRLRHAD